MKTYVCDICLENAYHPLKQIYMEEITFRDKIRKRKVHLCENCLRQIRDVSRNKKGEQQ
jgi:hypothetical protein